MYRHLIDLVNRLGHPRIAVVGDLMLDHYVFGNAERISPEAPIQVMRVASEESRLGGAGSVVNNLRALGADVSVFSVIGHDSVGEQVAALLKTPGTKTGGVVRLTDRPTTVKTRFVGRAQHRIPQQVLRVDHEQVTPIHEKTQDRLLAAIEKGLGRFQTILLSDYNKGVLTPRLTQAIIRMARRHKVPVLADPINDHDYSKYRGATLLTPNRVETETVIGQTLSSDTVVRRTAATLAKDLSLEALVITLDKDGAYLAAKGQKGQFVPTRPRRVYDNAGAGDMVISVVALVIAAGESFLDAVRLGNVAGGLEVEKFGVQTVSREEIVADLLGEARRAGDKLRHPENLLVDLNRHRSRGETVVFTNGCFDIIHAGHIQFLEFAKSQGDVLVLALNSDRSVRAIKDPSRPICTQKERARVLAGLQAVDYIVVFDEKTPARIVETVRPDVLVKGEDWRHKGVVGRECVESYGGRVVLAPLAKGLSTSELLKRICEAEHRGSA